VVTKADSRQKGCRVCGRRPEARRTRSGMVFAKRKVSNLLLSLYLLVVVELCLKSWK